VIEGQGRTLEEIDTMYLLGVQPWKSAEYVVPDLEQMSGKVRKRLEETNPEIAIANQNVEGTRGVSEEENEKREGKGSEDGLAAKKEEV